MWLIMWVPNVIAGMITIDHELLTEILLIAQPQNGQL